MIEQVFDEHAWRVMADDVVFATRSTRDEAEAVAEEQRGLAEKFGAFVRVEPPIVTALKT